MSAEVRTYEQEVIIVPVVLLFSFLVILVIVFLLRYCPDKVHKVRPKGMHSITRRPTRITNGIDGELHALPKSKIRFTLAGILQAACEMTDLWLCSKYHSF